MTTSRITPDRQQRMTERLDADMARAEAHDEHVWIVAAAFRISGDLAARLAAGEDTGALLDAENLVSLSPGCFRCEEPLTPRLLNRRCRGEVADRG
jgi:hypothetical protein